MAPRRVALQVLFGTGALVCVGAAAGPALRFALAPGAPAAEGGRFLRVAPLDSLFDGVPKRVEVVGDVRDAFTLHRNHVLGAVWLVRRGESVAALSATCPHLGCGVQWREEAGRFACPCHAARFDVEGRREAGPAPRGMDPLEVRVVEGWVLVDFRRFRTGTSERRAV